MKTHTMNRLLLLTLVGSTALVLAVFLAVSRTTTAYAQCGGAITSGAPISGRIARSGGDCWYSFSGVQGSQVTIRMDAISSTLDPWLDLYDPSDSRIAYDDDSGGNHNSRISVRLPASGTYEIRAASYNNSSSGSFTLELILGSGQSCGGALSPSDGWVSDQIQLGRRCEFTFYGRRGQTAAIAMEHDTAGTLDPWLDLIDPNGRIVASDDDGRGNHDSEITQDLVTTGEYTIVARSYQDSTAGTFYIILVLE